MNNNPDVGHRIVELLNEIEKQEIEDQVAEATRVISEIETIDSHAAFAFVQNQILKNWEATRFLRVLSRIAAILFLPLLLVAVWQYYNLQKSAVETKFAMQEITCPPGMRSQVILPDGSKVWLNAESTIQFPVPFPNESRTVNLIGEAFFDVDKRPEQPFIVHTANVKVKVSGTRFNYKAYQEDKNIEVILEEGKVDLSVHDNGMCKKISMIPGDRAVIARESNAVDIKNEKIDKYIAWHTGKLVFDNTPMSEVAQMLERWYGVEVIVQNPEIMDYSFTTTFDNESLFEVIELIELSSPIRIKYIPATIGKDNKAQSKSKVLIYKK